MADITNSNAVNTVKMNVATKLKEFETHLHEEIIKFQKENSCGIMVVSPDNRNCPQKPLMFNLVICGN